MTHPASASALRDRGVAWGLFVACAIVYLLSPVSGHADMRRALQVALSFARGDWGDLSGFPGADPPDDYTVARVGDRVLLYFPTGTSMLLSPVLWLLDRLAPSFTAAIAGANLPSLQRFFAAPISAAAVAVFYLAARERFARATALGLALVLAFCTPVWSTTSRVLWTHGPLVLAYAAALLLLLRAERRPALAPAVAIPLALGFVVRPTAALGIVAITALIALAHPRRLAPYLVCLAATLAPWIAYNLAVFGAVLPPYHLPGRLAPSTVVGEALLGTLVSPGRGLFVFTPVLLLAVPGFVAAFRTPRDRALACGLAAIAVAQWVVVSRFPHWWGGHSFGPRLMSDILPFLVFLAGYAVAPIVALAPLPRRIALVTVAALALVSAAIHGAAAVSPSASGIRWNILPADVDANPARLWDWHDPQVLTGLRHWRGLE